MKPLKIIYNVLLQISRDKNIPTGIDKEVIDALITLNLVNYPWDYELTEDGHQFLKMLENIYVKY
jgi:predicted transcriptional regulator